MRAPQLFTKDRMTDSRPEIRKAIVIEPRDFEDLRILPFSRIAGLRVSIEKDREYVVQAEVLPDYSWETISVHRDAPAARKRALELSSKVFGEAAC